MTTANVRNILRIPSRLCFGATDLTTAFPHGGTALGLTRDLVYHLGVRTERATAEEWGGVTSKAYYAGEQPYLAAVLREFDNDAINAIFPHTTVGSVSGDRYITFSPGGSGNRPGYDLTGKQMKLIVSPLSPQRHPFIIMYYAIPAIDETAQLNLNLGEEVGIGVVLWAGVDSSNRTHAIGKAEDINSVLS